MGALFGMQPFARIPPAHRDAFLREEARADLGGHQLAGGHHHGARAIAEFLRQVDALRQLLQAVEVALQLRADVHAQFRAQLAVPLLDGRPARLRVHRPAPPPAASPAGR